MEQHQEHISIIREKLIGQCRSRPQPRPQTPGCLLSCCPTREPPFLSIIILAWPCPTAPSTRTQRPYTRPTSDQHPRAVTPRGTSIHGARCWLLVGKYSLGAFGGSVTVQRLMVQALESYSTGFKTQQCHYQLCDLGQGNLSEPLFSHL